MPRHAVVDRIAIIQPTRYKDFQGRSLVASNRHLHCVGKESRPQVRPRCQPFDDVTRRRRPIGVFLGHHRCGGFRRLDAVEVDAAAELEVPALVILRAPGVAEQPIVHGAARAPADADHRVAAHRGAATCVDGLLAPIPRHEGLGNNERHVDRPTLVDVPLHVEHRVRIAQTVSHVFDGVHGDRYCRSATLLRRIALTLVLRRPLLMWDAGARLVEELVVREVLAMTANGRVDHSAGL
mmetsp:Transcript_25137/g.63089  ORF Transcript_25137/g.63089 Transcript_25137/m.63089 type:complete len:238 (-) Transcript_25137:1784-2497(-)